MKTETPITLADYIEKMVLANPNQVISTFKDEINVYNVEELNNRANLLAKGLLYNGVSKGTPVALVLSGTTNCLTFVIAISKIGAIFVPLNKDYENETIIKVLKQERIHTIGFYADMFLKKFQSIVPDYLNNERGYLQDINFPDLKNVVTFGSIKSRGIFTTRELMLVGEHMDDIEMEALIKEIKITDLFIRQITFDKKKRMNITSKTHGEIITGNFSLPALQNYLMNTI